MELTKEQIERFWANVDKIGTCWLWRRRWVKWQISAGLEPMARSVAWVLAGNPPPPKGKFLCVACENPRCLRHLVLGDNRRAARPRRRIDKGAMPIETRRKIGTTNRVSGEDHGRGRLTRDHVARILKSTATTGALAKRFGVSWSAIWQIRKRRTWKAATSY